MQPLDQHLAYLPLAAVQRQTLALMEVDVYQRRRLPQVAAQPVTDQRPAWDSATAELPLARAIARAGGCADAALWSVAWASAGAALPELARLRADPAAKRALWRQLRARLTRP